jgi:hypothetical protein
LRQKNGRLIKNISPTAQADLVKKFTPLQTGSQSSEKTLPGNGSQIMLYLDSSGPLQQGLTSWR